VQDGELLERERELRVLSELLEAACQGCGQLAVVEGVAGIGKTRLLAAARTEAARMGMRVLGARGLELEREFAYGVVRQLFEPVLTATSQTDREELLAGAAGQAAALFEPVDAATAASGVGDVSFARLHGLFWLTANLCAQGPLVFIVDDLHWSDVPSLRFLTYLLPRLGGLRLLVTAGLRPAEPTLDQHLLSQITTDALAMVIRPALLSQAASAQLVRTVLTENAEEEFCLACHIASAGNPLLLHELLGVAQAEGLEATAAGAVRLAEIGPRAVGQRVALRLGKLGPTAVALCNAVAILGDGAHPHYVAALAGVELEKVFETARQLINTGILYRPSPSPEGTVPLYGTLGFVHPLVRAAVYEELSETERRAGHAHAAHLLSEGNEAAERVAAHLLLVPPAGDSFVVATLRRAADDVFIRGLPESAVVYLERCLEEQPPEAERADILLQLGAAACLVDMTKGANYLAAAMSYVECPQRKAVIAQMLGVALHMAGRSDDAANLWLQSIQDINGEPSDLYWQLAAGLIGIGLATPNQRQTSAKYADLLRNFVPDNSLGGQLLALAIALHDALAPTEKSYDTAVTRVRRGLADGARIKEAHLYAVHGFFVLIVADLDEVIPLLETWIAAAHQRGSILTLSPGKTYRGLAWLFRGALAEAEADLRDAMWAAETAGQDIGRPIIAAYLADTLMEQGRLVEAKAVLDRVDVSEPLPIVGYWYWLLDSRGRFLILQGRTAEGLETLLACGRRFTAHGGSNPAVVAWRSGAALALLALARYTEAKALATEELILARQWGAPRALGHALRVMGLVQKGKEGLSLLHEAVEVLASSPARLEHAKALVDLGAALRRSGQRHEARLHLRRGIEIAQVCGAKPLVKWGLGELRATGARPRSITTSGIDALTPSERRVAELAAAGHSNRDIAQTLFITTNTVEVHLTRTYRKLSITRRTGLQDALRLMQNPLVT
jgi:DNA-binding CsgD family transcriptional regulator/tetratricopeptide (TPR) repeat protein